MGPKTLQALKESIAHWERAVADKNEPVGVFHCALCRMFNPQSGSDNNWGTSDILEEDRCIGCPVYEHTERQCCANTPWESIEDELDCCNDGSEAFRAAAQVELDFLRSLLPNE